MTINIADNNKESTKFLISYILLLFAIVIKTKRRICMLRRKILAMGLAVIIAGVFAGCNQTQQNTPGSGTKQYKDGTYYAEADDLMNQDGRIL